MSRPTRASRRGATASNRASTPSRRRRRPTTATTSPRARCRSSATRSASGASIPISMKSPNTPAISSRRTSRSSATRSQRIGMGEPGAPVSARSRQAANAVLQGGHRVRVAHAGHGRIRVARSARFPRPGHRAGGRARSVLGGERLRHGQGIQPVLQPHRAAGALEQAGIHHRRKPAGRPRSRALWTGSADECYRDVEACGTPKARP